LDDLSARLSEKKITVSYSLNLEKMLMEKGYNPDQGARPLKRTIQTLVEDKMATMMLKGKVNEGDHVKIDYKNGVVKIESLSTANRA
jgi:ATP-dependent Clp protease ATP-binding subunit ClpC